MSIRPVDFGGMIQRTDDVSALKHHEEQKAAVDQSNISVTFSKEGEEKLHSVQDKSDTEKLKNDSEGNGQNGQGNTNSDKKRKKKEETKVIKKSIGGGFDIKI